ncbi:hypothetical protein F7725_025443 [Dissostichus mawsoni]|uniref:Uncharacterized protein n=1 Tax=Dissostichus mawsoni TaxID=36200 RepID=A0A7J5XC29_DISMA|nr:hypothetical protein F7725_025443 [Dissostichus mawsoni]
MRRLNRERFWRNRDPPSPARISPKGDSWERLQRTVNTYSFIDKRKKGAETGAGVSVASLPSLLSKRPGPQQGEKQHSERDRRSTRTEEDELSRGSAEENSIHSEDTT